MTRFQKGERTGFAPLSDHPGPEKYIENYSSFAGPKVVVYGCDNLLVPDDIQEQEGLRDLQRQSRSWEVACGCFG